MAQTPVGGRWTSDLPNFTPKRLRARIAGWFLTTRANLLRRRGLAQAEPLYGRAVAIVERGLPLDDPAVLEPLWWVAEAALRRGDSSKAEAHFRRICGIYEATEGAGAPATAISQVRLARAIFHQGRNAEAEMLLRDALPIEERTLGHTSPYLAAGLEGLGDVLHGTRRYSEAVDLYQKAVATWRARRIGPTDNEGRQDFAMSLCKLAAALSNEGKLTDSETLFKESIELANRAFGPRDREIGIISGGLAWVKRRQGRLQDAERLYRLQYEISQERGDPTDLAQAAQRLGLVLSDLARFDEAEKLYRQAIRLRETLPGPGGSPGVHSEALGLLAELKVRRGKYVEAGELATRILDLITTQFGSENPELAPALQTLADASDGMGRCQEAHGHLLRALSVARTASDDLVVAGVLYALGCFGRDHDGLHGEGEASFRQALRIRKERHGSEHPEVANVLVGLADLYRPARIDQARQLYEQAVKIYDAWFGADYYDTADVLVDLAQVVVDHGELAQGNAILQRARALVEAALGTAHPDLARVLDGIGHLHAHAGRVDSAAQTFQHSLSITEAAFGLEHPQLVESLDRYEEAMRETSRPEEADVLKAWANSIRILHLQLEPGVA